MSSILIKNINVFNNNKITNANVFGKDGVIVEISEKSLDHMIDDNTKIFQDNSNKYLLPGFFDMHVHFRDFKQSSKETIKTGAASAFRGGYTGVAIMPNTRPALDNPSILKDVLKKSKNVPIDIYPFGSITKKRNGSELTEMFKLKENGVIGFSDDGDDVYDSDLMYNALNYASMTGLIVSCHSEDKKLSEGGHINEGKISSKWGIKGIPDVSESIPIFRNIAIAEFLKTKIHICHVSAAASINAIREFKSRGVNVTAETAPHYFSLTEDLLLKELNGDYKMNPPLRTESDRRSIIEALRDGTLDVIATDHAPHTLGDKNSEFEFSSFGIVGLETAFSVTSEYLYHKEKFSIARIVELLSSNPRKILGLEQIKIEKNEKINFTIVDFDEEVIVDKQKFVSKGRNTPFDKMKLRGNVVATFLGESLDINE